MRHGRANAPGTGSDSERALTPEGWNQGRRAGELLTSIAPTTILSSPAVRCVMTAEAVRAGLGMTDTLPINVHPALGCDDGSACLPLLAETSGVSLVVSHHPTLLSLGAVLLARAPLIDLRPGQVAVLEESGGQWALASVLDPGIDN
jgi:phosphohistidine phosphatase SixA